jgi:hypothetical protein
LDFLIVARMLLSFGVWWLAVMCHLRPCSASFAGRPSWNSRCSLLHCCSCDVLSQKNRNDQDAERDGSY